MVSILNGDLFVSPSRLDQVPELNELIVESARILSRGFYTAQETQSAIKHVFGVDTALVKDGSYFTAILDGKIVGCGGWSRRRTLYGGDQRPVGGSEYLNPATDPARIRAFFIAPQAARRGVGKAIFENCKQAALEHGFTSLELMATLPGVPFYQAIGFKKVEDISDVLPDGVPIRFERMQLRIG